MNTSIRDMRKDIESYIAYEQDYKSDKSRLSDSLARLSEWRSKEEDLVESELSKYKLDRSKIDETLTKLDESLDKIHKLQDDNQAKLDNLRSNFEAEYEKGDWSLPKYRAYKDYKEAVEVRDRTYVKIEAELEGRDEMSNKLLGYISKFFKGLYNILFGKDAGVSKLGGFLIVVGFMLAFYRSFVGSGNLLYKLLLIGVILGLVYKLVSPKRLIDNSLVLKCYSSIEYIDKVLENEKLRVNKYYKGKVSKLERHMGRHSKQRAELRDRRLLYIGYEYERRKGELIDEFESKYKGKYAGEYRYDDIKSTSLGLFRTVGGGLYYPKYDLGSLKVTNCTSEFLSHCIEDIIYHRPGSYIYMVDMPGLGRAYKDVYELVGRGFARVRDELVVTENDFLRMHERVVRQSSKVLRDKSLGLDVSEYLPTYIVYSGELTEEYRAKVKELSDLEGVNCIFTDISSDICSLDLDINEYDCGRELLVKYLGYEFEGGVISEDVCDGTVR